MFGGCRCSCPLADIEPKLIPTEEIFWH
jgi:hypothetical protein